ncbi:hypothetical protein [Metamycoplasma gateae]|uniref:Uncharacterized protein n=1 Tax=Metamycoplasma gateae TaxID=35769 RepID=A0ABZ2AGN6_9BACT|nr:hypothetical protein V2E26_02305 [Metamycoplasma gateae]
MKLRKLGAWQFLFSIFSILGFAFFITILVFAIKFQNEMQDKYNVERYEQLAKLMTKGETEEIKRLESLFLISLITFVVLLAFGFITNIVVAVFTFKAKKWAAFWLTLSSIFLTRFFGVISGLTLMIQKHQN